MVLLRSVTSWDWSRGVSVFLLFIVLGQFAASQDLVWVRRSRWFTRCVVGQVIVYFCFLYHGRVSCHDTFVVSSLYFIVQSYLVSEVLFTFIQYESLYFLVRFAKIRGLKDWGQLQTIIKTRWWKFFFQQVNVIYFNLQHISSLLETPAVPSVLLLYNRGGLKTRGRETMLWGLSHCIDGRTGCVTCWQRKIITWNVVYCNITVISRAPYLTINRDLKIDVYGKPLTANGKL
jgi:hypothetical protein